MTNHTIGRDEKDHRSTDEPGMWKTVGTIFMSGVIGVTLFSYSSLWLIDVLNL